MAITSAKAAMPASASPAPQHSTRKIRDGHPDVDVPEGPEEEGEGVGWGCVGIKNAQMRRTIIKIRNLRVGTLGI